MYPNLYKLLKVALTIPMSSVTCKHFISAMKTIKNWLQSSMGQEKCTNLSIIHIERQIFNDLCVKDMFDDFAKYNHHYKLCTQCGNKGVVSHMTSMFVRHVSYVIYFF